MCVELENGFAMLHHIAVPLVILQFSCLWLQPVNCIVSQWDPFCKDDILFVPYVRIFQKGRNGALLRDTGPGFIYVNGLQDIYVCTNGLVLLYYAKTNAKSDMGEIYEDSELRWAPHNCELYNPSRTALGIDQPKTLLSILLIGHPQDYRRPTLQMFVAPTYDPVYRKYVNITSLIMIGTDGECLMEKGVERAKLRVRINEPPISQPATPASEPEIPPWFCYLDSQRKLGQRGVINLNKPYENLFAERPTNIYTKHDGPVKSPKVATGSFLLNRFKASEVDHVLIQNKYSHKGILNVADQVYAALLNDRTMRFVGCHQYPDFNFEQQEFMKKQNILLNGDSKAVPVIDPADIEKLKPRSTDAFWKEMVIPPFDSTAETTAKTRLEAYAEAWAEQNYEYAIKFVTDAEGDLQMAKNTVPHDPVTIKVAELKLKSEKMKFSLWHLRQRFVLFQRYAKTLEDKLKTEWKKFRFDPYNASLVTLYDENLKNHTLISRYLISQGAWLGPFISNAETAFSQYNLYKELAKKSLADLVYGIRKMEKTKEPLGEVENTGDIFDTYFSDIIIDISNAFTPDGNAYDTNPESQACYALAAPIGTCKVIKPEASRACQICKNRKNQGVDWIPGTEWKQGVLDIIESIHKRVCPYISDEFAIAINRILKGYLLASPLGTGLNKPIIGYNKDHNYQPDVYNSTYWKLDTYAYKTSMLFESDPNSTLPPKESFWNQIIISLNDCLTRARPMGFFHIKDADGTRNMALHVAFPNNKSQVYFDVEDLFMQEKADLEYSFNWAIDMNWRIFSTVLGYCMPHYENKIPLISAQFYTLYSKHFLHPVRQIWMSNRDNPVLKTILGSFYGTGKGERWGKICMESSFVQSGNRAYRPPRFLYVNAFTEMNYFTTGPLSGTSGRIVDAMQ